MPWHGFLFLFLFEYLRDIFHVSIQPKFFLIKIKCVESEYFSISDEYIKTKI